MFVKPRSSGPDAVLESTSGSSNVDSVKTEALPSDSKTITPATDKSLQADYESGLTCQTAHASSWH